MSKKPQARRSKLDPYLHLVGKVPDREVAERAGMTPDGVRMYRQRHGIPSYRSLKKRLKIVQPAAASESGARTAFRVLVESDGVTEACVLVASDIAEAAREAQKRAKGTVVGLEYLGRVL